MSDKNELYLRNIIFGVSDSLVSTVGLLAGIDVSGTTKQVILLTGIVYAFVEAFSMAVGSFLSEQSAEEYEAKGEVVDNKAILSGIIMFVSFVVATFIPILPYMLMSTTVSALWTSIGLSIVALFILGLVSARIVRVKMFEHATKMAVLGGSAILIGVIVGRIVK